MSSSLHNTATVASAQATLLYAQKINFLGRFRAWLDQIQPHPFQRALSKEWVGQLKAHFEAVGLDRAAHPVKVLLMNEATSSMLPSPGEDDPIPFLPADVPVLEKWWYVLVYRQAFEDQFPAEFLALMHVGNETDVRLTARDIDRFLGVHRLRKLLSEQWIDDHAFEANKNRMTGSVKSVRRGITNLTKSLALSSAVARVVECSYLWDAFSAAGWRKLTTGWFYDLVSWILDEMMEQIRELKGDSIEVTSAPFMLGPKACHWDMLKKGVGSKSHEWHELPGGVLAAYERVSRGPQGFSTPLMKACGKGWTFKDTVLLPHILTSQAIMGPLNEMNRLAQHGQKNKDDHPVGIIYQVLGNRALRDDGTQKNYPHKIILQLWVTRAKLLEGLNDYSIEQATDTQAEEYQKLILGNESWWALLQLFKMGNLTVGLGLSIPKQFGPTLSEAPIQSRASSPAGSSQVQSVTIQMREPPSSQPQGANKAGPSRLTTPASQESEQNENHAETTHQDETNQSALPSGSEVRKHRKRPQVQDDEEDEDEFIPSHPTGNEAGVIQDELRGDSEIGHRGLNAQLHSLSEKSRFMDRGEASALAALLDALGRVEKGVIIGVVNNLWQIVPRLEKKVIHAADAMYDDDDDQDDDQNDGNDESGQVDGMDIEGAEIGPGEGGDDVNLAGQEGRIDD
ncbi:hypothetical protein CTheo_8446 [Ceratobasidium theobromae]|uniref:Uncharacterized protein n=1 Tax=Ceratobasidium theobromae TaxID=1582974 RepID=A0A5N5Q9E0_9AGAM|nr:hypothetical protein CTheo_8446 [Ceratobasidium theobromae]